ncbi:hypothetical protein JCM6882_007182 [Rhodosporidiobolus microsporus]
MTDKKLPYSPLSTSDDAPPPAYEASVSAGDPEDLVSRTARLEAQQPTPVPQMSIGGSRNPKSQTIGFDGKRPWNHSVCSCHETPGLTLGACCCPCLVYSSNRSRLAYLAQTGQPHPSPDHVGLWCCLYALSPQLFGVGQVALQCFSRMQTRQRYAVRGNVVEDLVVGAFCTTCSLVQESREIADEELALREGGPAPEVFYRDEEEAVAGAQAGAGAVAEGVRA